MQNHSLPTSRFLDRLLEQLGRWGLLLLLLPLPVPIPVPARNRRRVLRR